MTMKFPAKFSGIDIEDYAFSDLPDPDPNQHINDQDTVVDNTLRAQFALLGLKAYAARTGTLHQEEAETILSDFMGDVRHLCDALGIDFDEVSGRGNYHYEAEVHGEF